VVRAEGSRLVKNAGNFIAANENLALAA